MSALTPLDYAGYWNQAISFEQYFSNIETEAAGDTTTGNSKYIPINLQRMTRIGKTAQLSPATLQVLSGLKEKIYWLVITENWCGDSAQSIPIMHKIVEASNGLIEMRFIYRDQNLPLMNAHLTGTSLSIPKVIGMDTNFNVICTWGPRPDKAQELVLRLKFNPATAHSYNEELHKWYAMDKQVGIETGLQDLIAEAIRLQSATTPRPQP